MELNAIQQYPTPTYDTFGAEPVRRHSAAHVNHPYNHFLQRHQSRASQSAIDHQQNSPSLHTLSTQQEQLNHRNSQPPSWDFPDQHSSLGQEQGNDIVKQDVPRTPLDTSHPQSATLGDTLSSQSLCGLGLQNPLLHSDIFSGSGVSSGQDITNFEVSSLNATWNSKAFDESEFPPLDPEFGDLGANLLSNEDDTVIDIRRFHGGNYEADLSNFNGISRRISESSFSMSSCGAVAEVPSFEEVPNLDGNQHTAENEVWNDLRPNPSSLISPQPSPRRDEIARTNLRSKASSSPHGNMRTSPYTIDSRKRLNRWSTGTGPFATTSAPSSIPARPISYVPDRFATYGARSHGFPAPHYSHSPLGPLAMPTTQYLFSQSQHGQYPSSSPFYGTTEQPYALDIPRPIPSQGLFPLLPSNTNRHGGCSAHFADLSDPPDLYSSLHEEPSNPPEEDMNPSDPDLIPHEQDLRFNGDLYTPRWVRGHGNKREGWCGLCKPGRWLVLKNSAFWYDKSFTHGVSAATGAAFQSPQEKRRTEGNLDVWEGLCGSCGDWIALVSSKKKGTTWFRHAYKCHTHPKVKDGPKRRRETSHQIRARTVSSASTTTTASYPISKESSYDPPILKERFSPSDNSSDARRPFSSSAGNASSSPIRGPAPIHAHEPVGLGGVKSILAGMV